jgi:preprotein translocase SecA subunit
VRYYEQLFFNFRSLNPGTRYFINRLFNKEKYTLIQETISLLKGVNEKEEKLKDLSREEMKKQTDTLRKRIQNGESADACLVEGFALVREAARRTLNMRHFDVQILGGIVLHKGKIAEMATGEGKTLVATLSLFLNALEGKGCHLVTVNDYLAKRDTQWMGVIYDYLGLSVGCIISYKEAKGPYSASAFVFDPTYLPADSRFLYLRPAERKESYRCDITYGVGSEFGFDYLRDNMAVREESQVQRELNYAIIDEVDSILIDEARTPLIISGPSEETTQLYYEIDRLVRKLNKDTDFTLDEEGQSVSLTDEGVHKCERLMSIQNLYDGSNTERVHHINQALRAHNFFKRDKEYIVKNGQVVIVDEFTGRIMPGRRWSDGLHQAIEAKEGVRIERENQTLATISFQNYFKLYKKIAGMTGTALTESLEFKEIYHTDVMALPTNKILNRTEYDDEIYKTENDKFKVITEEIEKTFKENRPILIGTASIEKAEKLSRFLSRKNIPHNVLHGKNHEAEAAIIAQAGRSHAVTIATQMAGRGVDIILGGNPEILAREETIKVIWSRKKATTGDKNREQEFAGALTEIENSYKKRLSDAEKDYKVKIDSIRNVLNEKESIFVSLDRKANDLFEGTIFSKQGSGSFERYQPRLLKLRELHDRASADLAEAQNTFKDKQEKLKDFKESAGRTYREYLAFKNSLKERFGIVLQEDIEEKRNSITELLNSAEASSAEGIRKILNLLESYGKSIQKYLSIMESTFSSDIPENENLFQKTKGREDHYVEYIQKMSEDLAGGGENTKDVLKRFIETESRLYGPYLEARNTLEKRIKSALLEEDYDTAEKEYKTLLKEYEKEYAHYDEELKKAREEYEENRTRYEDEWQKAREELEKTPEEFKEVYERLLEKYKTPWQQDHQKVVDAGGLHVIGSERYEARRIDNQLKGRAGRQGDPGSSKFYLSLDDDLLRIFGSERMLGVMGHLPEGEAITHPLITKMINNAQKKVEARNFEIRKQLLEFDNVLNEQRKIIYAIRQDILEGKNVETYIKEFMEETLDEGLEEFMNPQVKPFTWNLDNFSLLILNTFDIKVDMPQPDSIRNPLPWRDQLKDDLLKKIQDAYREKEKEVGQYLVYIQKIIMLQVIDNRWKAHLRVIDELREGISLRAYAQRDPLLAYKHEGYQEFQRMLSFIKKEILSFLFRVQVSKGHQTPQAGIPEQVPIVPHTEGDITYGHKNLEQFDVTKKDKEPGEYDADREMQTGKIEPGTLPVPPHKDGTLVQERQQPANQPYMRGKKKIGRNDPCPCGSGKKYKNCCGRNL